MHIQLVDWLLLPLALALLAAAIWDLRTRTIPNSLNLAIALGAIGFWWAEGLSLWPGVIGALLVAAIVFAIFAGAFALGMMGGGDVKMIAAIALWLPLAAVFELLMIMALAGGAVTLLTAGHHRLARREGRPEIPYGVAIAFAGLWLIGERYLYHFG